MATRLRVSFPLLPEVLSVGASWELPRSPQKLPLCPPCALPLWRCWPSCVPEAPSASQPRAPSPQGFGLGS